MNELLSVPLLMMVVRKNKGEKVVGRRTRTLSLIESSDSVYKFSSSQAEPIFAIAMKQTLFTVAVATKQSKE